MSSSLSISLEENNPEEAWGRGGVTEKVPVAARSLRAQALPQWGSVVGSRNHCCRSDEERRSSRGPRPYDTMGKSESCAKPSSNGF